MNYKKLITKRLSNLQGSSSDKTTALVGLMAGLAVGAVLGILFAPDSGKKTRERISDKALDLTDNAKDSIYAIKDKINNGKDSLVDLKDRVVENVKSRVGQATEEFKEFRNSELEKTTAAAYEANGTDQHI